MDEITLSVCRSVVSPQALLEHILPHYSLNRPVTCQLLTHSHDDLYCISADSDEFVLRVYAQSNHREDLVAQAVILEKMIAAKLSVVQPVQSNCGYVLDVPAPEGMRHA